MISDENILGWPVPTSGDVERGIDVPRFREIHQAEIDSTGLVRDSKQAHRRVGPTGVGEDRAPSRPSALDEDGFRAPNLDLHGPIIEGLPSPRDAIAIGILWIDVDQDHVLEVARGVGHPPRDRVGGADRDPRNSRYRDAGHVDLRP